ncbi:MAG: nicotinate-nucleotide adenylyltransferase [Pyrinomonadaceae bacterium]
MKRVAVFGGTFDPVHVGHLTIARRLVEIFNLDRFVFLPAFHAPHKPNSNPTSAFHRFSMLSIATENDAKIFVSTHEIEKQEPRYTIDTLGELIKEYGDSRLFFVMGADSWMEIKTWRRWEEILILTDHIVVTRPGVNIGFDHVTDQIRDRIVDLRGDAKPLVLENDKSSIYITDAVWFDTSATELRDDLSDGELERKDDLSDEVAKYIEKYELYT